MSPSTARSPTWTQPSHWSARPPANSSTICGGTPRVVDTHCHLIYRQRMSYPWLQKVPELNRDFMIEDYLAQARAAGVSDIVYMEADVHESQMEAEAAFAGSLSERIVGVVAACRPESRDFPAATWSAWLPWTR
jgi:predicted TIM-barrel fold metal-dependent hydrolase